MEKLLRWIVAEYLLRWIVAEYLLRWIVAEYLLRWIVAEYLPSAERVTKLLVAEQIKAEAKLSK